MNITVATGPYIHLAELAHVPVDDGLELRHEVREPGKIFRPMLDEGAWDVGEMSLATAYLLADKRDERFVALPVFPSRTFRHSALYVPAHARARSPGEFAGARVGVLRYAMTTAVWVRDLLERQYGVPAKGLQWFVGEDSPHPDFVSPTVVGSAGALERLAVSGDLDLLISGRPIADQRLQRLFPRFGEDERAYHESTGVFPIMHTLVAKRTLVQSSPALVPALMARFRAAKGIVEERLANFDISAVPVPWLASLVEESKTRLNGEPWPYGIAPNRGTLDAFARALHAEGSTSHVLSAEEVFEDA